MASSKKILINTLATYGRSVLSAALALFSGRWVLAALGASDFGLFSVVGAIIVFITFLNGVMAGSASRHLAFAIGRGETEEANKWFNTALVIHLLLPTVLILIGLPAGEYCIHKVFAIPPDRIDACIWVFRMSLVVAFVNMSAIPYVSMFNAKQHLSEIAGWGMLLSVYNFVLAYALTKLTGDLLLVYAGFGMLGQLLFLGIQIVRARILFPESRCHLKYWFDRKRFVELFSFASWSLFGSLGFVVRSQGSSILINLFFGTKVNAAFGIGSTVSTQASTFSTALRSAMAPEITSSEGRGDRARVINLALLACKSSALLIMLFAIPLLVEMEYVLNLWLRQPPPYTTIFCCLMLGELLIDSLTIGHMLAINASGRIAAYNVILGVVHALAVPAAWVFLKTGHPPGYVGIAALMTSGSLMIGRVLFARNLINMSARRWFQEVFLPSVAIGIGSASAAAVSQLWMSPSFLRLSIASGASFCTIGVLGWWLVLRPQERSLLINRIAGKVSAFKRRTRAEA